MKICLINNLYKPYNRGGAERVVELIAEGLINAGHDVFIITTKPIFKELRITNYELRIYYINGIYYNLDKLPKFLRLFWHIIDMFDIGGYLKIKSVLKKENPDVVMTHNLKGIGYLIPGLIKKLNIKHIHTLHDMQLLHPSGLMLYGKEKIISSPPAKIYAAACRRLFGSPDAVISPSNWLMEIHVQKGFFKNSRQTVLPNPVSPAAQPSYPKKTAKTFRFLYVGQIEEHKGVLFLINAFKKFNTGLNRELVIIGKGLKSKQAASQTGGQNNIKFTGAAGRQEVLNEMRRADCLIMPSLCYENSPAVIYEGFAAGLPIIAADIGGVGELLADGAGLLFKPGDEDDLINKMKWASDNPQELIRMGERGREKIQKFNIEKYIDKLLNITSHI